jgi:hypothetical protein
MTRTQLAACVLILAIALEGPWAVNRLRPIPTYSSSMELSVTESNLFCDKWPKTITVCDDKPLYVSHTHSSQEIYIFNAFFFVRDGRAYTLRDALGASL